MKWFLCGLWAVLKLLSPLGFSQEEHRASQDRIRPKAEMAFSFVVKNREPINEVSEDPQQTVYLEYGHIPDGPERKKAMRLYQGNQFQTESKLNLLAVHAGSARTVLAARALCERQQPQGAWRLVSLPQVMAFFKPLLEGYPLPNDPKKNGILFWAETSENEFNKRNRDVFFTAPAPNELGIENQSYFEFVQNIQKAIPKIKDPVEKKYLVDFLKYLRGGIPAICITGQEP